MDSGGAAAAALYDMCKKISQVIVVVEKSATSEISLSSVKSVKSATSENPVTWVRAPLNEILPSFR
jgi:hypothetical protein